MNNEMHLQFPAKSINESFARLVIIGFIAPLDPNSQELNEIKTIVSEGVTNAIIHGYEDNEEGIIEKVMAKVKPDTNAAEILAYLNGEV